MPQTYSSKWHISYQRMSFLCRSSCTNICKKQNHVFSLIFNIWFLHTRKANHSVLIEQCLPKIITCEQEDWSSDTIPPLNMSENKWINNGITWNPNASESQSSRSRTDIPPCLCTEDMCGIGRPSMILIASIAPLIYIIYRVTRVKINEDFHKK